MSINLSKGENVNLTKDNPMVSKFKIGLGWNANTTVGDKFDLDVSAFVLGEDGKLLSNSHFVFYNNLKSPNELVVHTGDNRTGEGDGDDENLIVDFSKTTNENKILFVVTIHEAEARRQNFGQVSGSYIRILNDLTNEELVKYELDEDLSIETAMSFGELYLRDGEWKFKAIGTGFAGGLQEYLNQYL